MKQNQMHTRMSNSLGSRLGQTESIHLLCSVSGPVPLPGSQAGLATWSGILPELAGLALTDSWTHRLPES